MRGLRSTCSFLLFALLLAPAAVRGQGEPAAGEAPQVALSGLFYLTYEEREIGDERTSEFFVHRAYLTSRVRILPRLSARIPLDTSQDLEGDGRGDMEVRLKYAHAVYDVGDWRLLRGLELEAGIVHMVWLDFEEHVNLYRMRDPMFVERTGIFNSADFGITLTGDLGPQLPEAYRRSVTSSYAARYGSFAVGLYNGTGYHGDERNRNKVVQGRLTIRPLPDILPGFQVSGLAIHGKGNQSDSPGPVPDWRTYDVFLSLQGRRGTLTAQYMWGEGNQSGRWTEPGRPGVANDYSGFSAFGEARLGPTWLIIGGFDTVSRMDGTQDLGFRRVHGGAGFDLGRRNIVLVDLDRRDWDSEGRPAETRGSVVFQVRF